MNNLDPYFPCCDFCSITNPKVGILCLIQPALTETCSLSKLEIYFIFVLLNSKFQ
jgi:hypothetical protein